MLESGWLFLGCVATLVTAGTVLTTDDGWAIVLGVVGFVSWGMFAYASLDVVAVGDAVTYNFTLPVMTLFGVMMSLLPGYIALTGPVDLITGYRSATADDL
jgi:hypothetical protein